MNPDKMDLNDPDRHYNRIKATAGISTRIKKLSSKRKQIAKQETQEERLAKLLVCFLTASVSSHF